MWLKKTPINLFSLALLIAALYFTIFNTNVYATGVLSFLLGCFFKAIFQYESTMFSIKTSREIIRLLPLPILRNFSSCCACVVRLSAVYIYIVHRQHTLR